MKRLIAICGLMMLCFACFAESGADAPLDEHRAPAVERVQATPGQRADSDTLFFIAELLKSELRAQENAAVQAYFQKSPEVAAWAMEELINSFNRNSLIMRDLISGWEEEIKTRRLFAHARLFKLYTSMNDEKQAQHHLVEAIRLGDGKSIEMIMQMVDELDGMQSSGGEV